MGAIKPMLLQLHLYPPQRPWLGDYEMPSMHGCICATFLPLTFVSQYLIHL